MTNTELIDALRYCADEDKICTEQTNCGYYGKGFFCQDVLLRDAADAIEKLLAEIDRKDKALQAWVKTWEQRKDNAIRHICDHCDTPIEVRLKEGACEDCPIITLVKEIFDDNE